MPELRCGHEQPPEMTCKGPSKGVRARVVAAYRKIAP
jgi:hypothetical protein